MRPLHRRPPQQAEGRHALRAAARMASARADAIHPTVTPSRGRLARLHETRACKSELQGDKESPPAPVFWGAARRDRHAAWSTSASAAPGSA